MSNHIETKTGPFTLDYFNLEEPKAYKPGDTEFYNIRMLFDPEDKATKKFFDQVYKFGELNFQDNPDFTLPYRKIVSDDIQDYEKGMFVAYAKAYGYYQTTKKAPPAVYTIKDNKVSRNTSNLYRGLKVVATVKIKTYDFVDEKLGEAKQGLSLFLSSMCIIANGHILGDNTSFTQGVKENTADYSEFLNKEDSPKSESEPKTQQKTEKNETTNTKSSLWG